MKVKLLLVEDEIDLQQNIKDILEIFDFEVLTADNGQEAIKLLNSEKFDIVVSDVMMPKMDGFELLKRVRSDKKLINLPFLFLTAKVEKEDLRKGMEFGAEDYLTKPVHAKDLIGAINAAINKKRVIESWLGERIDEVLSEERNVKYHELRTPLFGLMSILEMVTTSIDTFDSVQLKEILETAYNASKRLNESLLNLARYNGLKSYLPKKNEILSIKKLIEEALYLIDKECEFICDADFSIQFEIETLRFILNELFRNASKFSSMEPIFIFLKGRTLTVANYQDYIESPRSIDITPFGQINREYLENQGLGLGLFLSRSYAIKNNAELAARINDDLKFVVSLEFPGKKDEKLISY
jgi:two-component system, sensor histidine kinase and response regulator